MTIGPVVVSVTPPVLDPLLAELSVSVGIIESHELVSRGLAEVLAQAPGVRLVTVAASGTGVDVTGVDVVIVSSDIAPGELGRIVCACGAPKVLVLLRDTEPDTLAAAAQMDVAGYVLERGISAGTLASAVHDVCAGRAVVPADLSAHLLRGARDPGRHGDRPAVTLTPRERQVLSLLATGLRNRAIAAELEISEHGVKRLVGNVLAKLGEPNRTAAVIRALRDGL